MTLYLNNTGHRWIDTDKSVMRFVLVLPDGQRKVRHADCYEAFGNFAVLCYRYQGKRFRGFPKSASGFDTRVEGESLAPHIFHAKSAGFREVAA